MTFKLKKYENNPILKPNPKNAWEDLVVCNPGAWYEDGKFSLLYRAAGDDVNHFVYLGLAESTDGFNFERVSDEPVLSPTPNNFDSGCVEDPRIVKFGDTFYVTYAYRPFAPGRYWEEGHKLKPTIELNEYAPNGLLYNTTNTGLAISKDLRNFKKLGRITQHGIDNRDVILFPEKINGKFVMLHRPVEWVGEEYGCTVPSTWIAFSDDLMTWGNDKLLATSEYEWENAKMGGSTPPLRTDEGWLVLYHGVAKADGIYRVGAMMLDLEDPTKIIARSEDFIMEPEFYYETDGYYTGCVFPTGNVIVDETLFVYYGGADKFVCAASCNVNELIKHIFSYNK